MQETIKGLERELLQQKKEMEILYSRKVTNHDLGPQLRPAAFLATYRL